MKLTQKGLELYNEGLEINLNDPQKLKALDFYKLAVVAIMKRDLTTLLRLDKELNGQGDEYFWLYMSNDEKLFYSSFYHELVRNRHVVSPIMYSFNRGIEMDEYKGDYSLSRYKRRLSKNGSFRLTSNVQLTKKRTGSIINHNLLKPNEILRYYYNPSIYKLLDMIYSQPSVYIAGGFVNGLITPAFELIEIVLDGECEYSDRKIVMEIMFFATRYYNINRYRREDVYSYVTPYSIDWIDTCKNYEIRISELKWEQRRKLFKYDPDMYEIISLYESFFDKNANHDEIFDNFPLIIDKALENPDSIAKYLITKIDGKYYSMIYQKPNDIDIFFTKDRPQERAVALVNLIDKETGNKNEKYTSLNALSIDFSIDNDKYRIQLIKRAFNDRDTIVVGFDLDSSMCLLDKVDGEYIFIGTETYYIATKYGINVITPSRQSHTFNKRLKNYIKKGYLPVIPGNPEKRFDYQIPRENTFSELLLDKIDNGSEDRRYILDEKKKDIAMKINNLDLSDYGTIYKRRNGMNTIRLVAFGLRDPTWEDVAILMRYIKDGHDIFLKMKWRWDDSDSQITSTFNPTNFNYFGDHGSEPVNLVFDEIENLMGVLNKYLNVNDLSRMVEDYSEEKAKDYWDIFLDRAKNEQRPNFINLKAYDVELTRKELLKNE